MVHFSRWKCIFNEISYDAYIAELRRLPFTELYVSNFVYATSKRHRLHTQLAKFAFKLAHRVLEYVIRYYNFVVARFRVVYRMWFCFDDSVPLKKIKQKQPFEILSDLCQQYLKLNIQLYKFKNITKYQRARYLASALSIRSPLKHVWYERDIAEATKVTRLSWGCSGASAKRASSRKLVDNSLATLRAFPPWRHDRQPTLSITGIQLSRRSYHRPGEDNARRMSPREDDVRVRARKFPDFSHVSDERIKRDPMITVLATCQRSPTSVYLSPNRTLSEL